METQRASEKLDQLHSLGEGQAALPCLRSVLTTAPCNLESVFWTPKALAGPGRL